MIEPLCDSDRQAMLNAVYELDLNPRGAVLVSTSSRQIWHLPDSKAAVTISRPGMKSLTSVTAEATAIQAASAAGVRTPHLRGGPVALASDRFAIVTDWLTGRKPTAADWPAIAYAAAGLAGAAPAGVPVLAWPVDMPPPFLAKIGESLAENFRRRCLAAARMIQQLTNEGPLVLAHGDLQPANVLCDDAGQAWLIDLEYACQAPREWDPAKIVILARRFADPSDTSKLLSAWVHLDTDRLARCIAAQEALLVTWLVRMAAYGTAGAAAEAAHRAASLSQPSTRWGHLT